MDLSKQVTEFLSNKITAKIKKIIPLNSITNNTYKIICSEGAYVIRWPHQQFNYPFNVEDEYLIATKTDFDAPLIYLDQQRRKITKFIKSDQFDPMQNLKQIILTLKQLHAYQNKAITHFDYLTNLKSFHQRPSLISEKKIINDNRFLLNQKYQSLCHNDLVFSNILKINNKIQFIDFEYACLNDPLFDLASLISENNLSESQGELVLKYYFKQINNEHKEKLKRWLILQDIYWYHWARQAYKNTKLPAFKQIAEIKKKNYLRRLAHYFC